MRKAVTGFLFGIYLTYWGIVLSTQKLSTTTVPFWVISLIGPVAWTLLGSYSSEEISEFSKAFSTMGVGFYWCCIVAMSLPINAGFEGPPIVIIVLWWLFGQAVGHLYLGAWMKQEGLLS